MLESIKRWVSSKAVHDIEDVQSTVQSVCKFVPTATTVFALLGRPGLATAGAVAYAICEELNRSKLYLHTAEPAVRGVAIRGFWT